MFHKMSIYKQGGLFVLVQIGIQEKLTLWIHTAIAVKHQNAILITRSPTPTSYLLPPTPTILYRYIKFKTLRMIQEMKLLFWCLKSLREVEDRKLPTGR